MSAVAPPNIDLPRRTISVEEYHRMAEVGLLAPEERVELLEGEVIEMAAIGPPHMLAVNRLTRWLVEACGDAAVVSVQHGVILPPRSEPRPDVALLKPEFFRRVALPQAEDVVLVIEVPDTTVAKDRDLKGPLYARHDICEYWLVNLPRRVIAVYRKPGPDGYREMFERAAGERLSPEALPRVDLDVGALFDFE